MTRNQLHTEVVIIGAGPAGAATSIFLSKHGIRHVILERERFPRDKVCGDAVSGKSVSVLRRANAAWLREIFEQTDRFTPSHGLVLAAPNGKALDIPFGRPARAEEVAPGFTVPRLDFDNYLFHKIDRDKATVLEGVQVLELKRQEGNVSVLFEHEGRETELKAAVVVGADGDKSIVRRKFLQEDMASRARAIGLRAYYSGVTGLHRENFIELHFLKNILPGYFWIFPLPGGMANVGVGIDAEVVRKRNINLRAVMLEAIEKHPLISQRFQSARLHGKIQGWGLPMARTTLPLSGDQFLLTGDAANLVDAFTGEGIGNALYSGMLAADAIRLALEKDRFDGAFLKEVYDAAVYRELGKELRLSARLQSLCRYPWLLNMVVNKALKSPALGNLFSRMFEDLDLRNELRKPSFYLNILLNR